MTIGRAIDEPLLEHRLATKADVNDRVAQILEICGMDAGAMDRYPHEFSGGQRQRIVIMYLGAVVETGSRDEIFSHPIHPYTKELLAAVIIAAHPGVSCIGAKVAPPNRRGAYRRVESCEYWRWRHGDALLRRRVPRRVHG